MTRPADPRSTGRATAPEPGDGHPTQGSRRLVRVVGLGGSSLALAGAAHLVAGGRLPPAGVLAVLTGLVGLVALTLTARRCRLPVLVAVLGVEQLALHGVLTAATLPAVAGGCLAGSHSHHALVTSCLAPGAPPTAVPAAAGAAMWLLHGAAVLVTAWLLARGETLLWRAVDRIADAVPLLRARAVPRRPRPRTPAPVDVVLRRHHPAAVPRGPPLLA
ncbi:hypothetical protein GCM10009616_19820 [Microlunatus lacustris]